MQQPSGFVDSTLFFHVCWLHKSLYGLKQVLRHGTLNLVIISPLLAFMLYRLTPYYLFYLWVMIFLIF
jgi:hypothetical protein